MYIVSWVQIQPRVALPFVLGVVDLFAFYLVALLPPCCHVCRHGLLVVDIHRGKREDQLLSESCGPVCSALYFQSHNTGSSTPDKSWFFLFSFTLL